MKLVEPTVYLGPQTPDWNNPVLLVANYVRDRGDGGLKAVAKSVLIASWPMPQSDRMEVTMDIQEMPYFPRDIDAVEFCSSRVNETAKNSLIGRYYERLLSQSEATRSIAVATFQTDWEIASDGLNEFRKAVLNSTDKQYSALHSFLRDSCPKDWFLEAEAISELRPTIRIETFNGPS